MDTDMGTASPRSRSPSKHGSPANRRAFPAVPMDHSSPRRAKSIMEMSLDEIIASNKLTAAAANRSNYVPRTRSRRGWNQRSRSPDTGPRYTPSAPSPSYHRFSTPRNNRRHHPYVKPKIINTLGISAWSFPLLAILGYVLCCYLFSGIKKESNLWKTSSPCNPVFCWKAVDKIFY